MPDPKLPPDPSMDEILAAIRRLVADDERANGDAPHFPSIRAEPAAAAADADVLELTEAIAEDGSIRRLPPYAAAAAAAPAPVVSAAASSAAGAAFRRLAAALDDAGPVREPVVIGDRPLADIVEAELRPLLRAWLDVHLPGIVERLVAAEIARIAGRAGPQRNG